MLLWFVFFEWNFVPYPTDSGYGPFVCYSPNHEYYIKRYQTPVQAIQDQLYAKGVAILYDKTGKKLYSSKAALSGQHGPVWGSNIVLFGEAGDDWQNGVNLPSSPGEHPNTDEGCFDEKSDYVKPRLSLPPRRDFIVKGVEPLVKTNASFQLQFLIEDQHGVPFTPLYYLIIREDGFRQRGETDGHGRSFVIESTHDEAVKIYFSPLQTKEGFVMPEDIQNWCSEGLDECIKTHTFTANTIKVEPANTKAQ